jgi:hypothetical protein
MMTKSGFSRRNLQPLRRLVLHVLQSDRDRQKREAVFLANSQISGIGSLP